MSAQLESHLVFWGTFLHVHHILGPVSGMLCDRFTCQKVVIVGGLLSCLGCVLSAFAPSLNYLYITFAVIGKP